MKKLVIYAITLHCLFISILSFTLNSPVFASDMVKPLSDSSYIKSIQIWHQQRIESLKSETGWLNLAGLFWLKEGKNTFGSSKTNDIVFPKGAEKLGSFTLINEEVTVDIDPKAQVFIKNDAVSTLKIFPTDKNLIMQSSSLRWFIIKRGPKIGVRLRDVESDVVKHFGGIHTYPIDSTWRIKARLETSNKAKTVDITDVLGQTGPQPLAGTLVFKISGKTYRLDAIDEGNDLFIIFADDTNGKETYGSGRFLYAQKPDANGVVYLDFNKAINPPCAFTPYATCPLPPKQNKLVLAILSGEKNFGDH
ncbi:MAG: DUF1684 domain-containing protein [Saprospiraceae bacterium]|nr:DUF1684 domain-containing protein [Saprospiraceae bacterium]